MNNFEKLTILPVNKSVVFSSPIEENLVRTGTIKEGSCFFHALLHAYSKDYASMNTSDRMSFVKKLRLSISKKVSKEKWENLSNGLVSKTHFQKNVNTILTDLYKHITTGCTDTSTNNVMKITENLKDNIETYKLITEMIPLEEGFEKNILPSAYDKCNRKNISKCKKYIIKHAVNYYKKQFDVFEGQLDENSIKYYLIKLEYFIKNVLDESENKSYNDYIKNLSDSSSYIDSYTIGLISEKFNRDIYFIDEKTRMPYKDSNFNIRKRKSIIVMYINECHYEIIGRLLPDNMIQREFDFKDDLIKKIYTFLCNPEKIPKEYPNLIPFLPKELRKTQLEVYDNNEEKENSLERFES